MQEEKASLTLEISEFQSLCEKTLRFNKAVDKVLVISGLLAGLLVMVAGLTNQAYVAAALGMALTATISLQNAFAFGEAAAFCDQMNAEAMALRRKLKYKVKTDDELNEVVDQLDDANFRFVKEMPRGKGMEVIRAIQSQFSKAGPAEAVVQQPNALQQPNSKKKRLE